MGVRNVLVLFFSAMAVSMVILIVFFSLFFKNFDNLVTFDTKLPESAPDLGTVLEKKGSIESSKSDGTSHSTINVPSDYRGGGNTTTVSTSTPSLPKDPVVDLNAGAGVQPMDPNEVEPETVPEVAPEETTGDAPEKPKKKKAATHPPVKPVKKESVTVEPPPPPVLPPLPPAMDDEPPKSPTLQ